MSSMNTQKYKDMGVFFHQIYLTCEIFLRILEDLIQFIIDNGGGT